MSMIRRNSGPLQRNAWASSPRTKLVLFFVAFAVTYGAIRAWQIIIESDNVYLETGAAFITVIILFGIYWYYMRQYTAYRRRLNELRQAHPHPSTEEETDLNSIQLRLYLQRVYGSSVNIEALLTSSGGLTIEAIDSLVRHFTFSAGKGGEGGCKVQDIELGMAERGMNLGRTDSNITATPPVSRYCSIDKVDYEDCDDVCSKHEDESAPPPPHSSSSPPLPPTSSSPPLSTSWCLYTPVLPYGPPVECSVCLGEYCDGDALTELPCKHTYHRVCVTEWLLRQNACPMCKQMVLQLPVLAPEHGDDVDRGFGSGDVHTPHNVHTVNLHTVHTVPASLEDTTEHTSPPPTLASTGATSTPSASDQVELPPLQVVDVDDEGADVSAVDDVRTPSFLHV